MYEWDMDTVQKIVACLTYLGASSTLTTDTVYGLAVVPTMKKSVDRLYSLKNRPKNLNLPIMVSSWEELEILGFDLNESVKRLLRSPLIPGSLTFVMGFGSEDVPHWVRRDETKPRSEFQMMIVFSRS